MEEIILYCRKSLKEIIFSQRLFLKSVYDCNSKFTRSIIYICTEIYCKMNMSNKNDALQSTRNLIGCTIFLTSEKYRMTNHNPQTKVFTSDKNRIDFPAFH